MQHNALDQASGQIACTINGSSFDFADQRMFSSHETGSLTYLNDINTNVLGPGQTVGDSYTRNLKLPTLPEIHQKSKGDEWGEQPIKSISFIYYPTPQPQCPFPTSYDQLETLV